MVGNGFACAARFGVVNSEAKDQYINTNDLIIYPNPAKNILNVWANNFLSIGRFEIIDVLGKTIKSNTSQLGITNIDISNLSNGLYTIIFITKQGNITKKFIVE